MNGVPALASWHFAPISNGLGWAVLALMSAATLLLLARGAIDRWRWLADSPGARAAIIAMSFLALAFTGGAVVNLARRVDAGRQPLHLAVVLDASDSVTRSPEIRERQLQNVQSLIRQAVSSLSHERVAASRGSIVTFGLDAIAQVQQRPLTQLADSLGQLPQHPADGGATDIEAGLRLAAREVRRSSGAGLVLLVTDGNETRGRALGAAESLRQQGIPIYVMAVEGPGPILWITDAFLPRRIKAGDLTAIRVLFRNDSGGAVPTELRAAFNANSAVLTESTNAQTATMTAPPGRPGSARFELKFARHGIQYADVEVSTPGREAHRRRLFCYAERPPRLLSIGGDRRWEEALDRQAWEWESAGPEEMPAKLNAIAAGDYDAVVIGALTARQFRNEDLEALAQAVRERGLGLFIWNGDHNGQSELTEAVLTTYRDTPLESILPVHVDPRKVKPEPPPRQVIVVVDRSGSMAAGRPSRLARAQSICRSIIGAMRPEDTLDLLAFDDRLAHLVDNEAMTPDAKARAIAQVDGLTLGGGTLPSVGLTFLARRTLTRAALIFISDGGFDPGELAAMSVFASTNAFATVEYAFNTNQPSFARFPTVVPALESFDASKLQLKFFQREERNKFFEAGMFDPVETPVRSGRFRGVSLPGMTLNGNAVCFAKPEAAVIGVRRKIADPVLVYGEAGEGRVGVFTSGLTDEWLRGEVGRSAINGWLKQLVPFSERDRYDFKIEDDGQTLRLEVTILARNGRVPRVEALNAFLSSGPHMMKPVHLTADPNSPGTFRGQAGIERTDHAQPMHLTLTESGAEAVPRPQRVPLLVPPAGRVRAQSTEEAWTHGRNTKLLEQLADVSGGRLVDINSPVLFTDAASTRREYWRELIAIAAFLYLAAIGVRRWNG